MPAHQPTADRIRASRDDPHDGLIAEVDLLELRVQADDAGGHPLHGADEAGATADERSVDAFPGTTDEAGATCLYGETERYFIGQGDCDAVQVMHFPSRAASIHTLNHPDHQEMHRHRDAGLLGRNLITTRPVTTALDGARRTAGAST